jgi:membrane-bound metal-dependent hydrolase YbcI (DUF457 family)
MEPMKDQQLWETAKQRAAFKRNLAAYFLVNTFLVCVWYFTNGGRLSGHFWPLWPILGWGFGLALQYVGAYHGSNYFSVEKEYEDLKKKVQ